MPSFHAADDFPIAVDSIKCPSNSLVEIIAVDDASTDYMQPFAELRSNAFHHPRIERGGP